MNRTAGAAALTAVLLTALLASWFSGGWRAVRAEQRTLRAAPRLAAERTAREVADELAARLDQLRRREDARPYYHYQNLFHDPRGAAVGAAVTPSPLAAGPDDPLVAAHFQIDAAGAVTLPTLNEDVPELNAPDLADNRAMRDALASVAPSLRPDDGPGGVAIAALEPSALGNADPIQQVQQGGVAQRPRVEVLDQDAYLQNTYSQQVYQNARAGQVVAPEQLPVQQAERGGAPTGKVARRDAARDRVAVTVAPLAWRRVEVAGAPALVAVRRVDTPDGPLTQGLVVPEAALAELIADDDRGATLHAGAPPADVAAAPLAVDDGAWYVAIDDAAAVRAADARAAAVATGFLVRFVPTAALAILCAVLVVLLVARAERIARQRAAFAAAAAHELRTPLAGLQLYGDMLADGLGDPTRAHDYARHMAEEAARLGRVVTNVLDFSRLERGNLAVSAAARDLGDAVAAIVERSRPALERAGATLTYAPPAAPVRARVDDDALARVLGNLLDNAEKYGRDAADRSITVRVAADGDAAIVEVRDAGPGLAAAEGRRLFDPFARGVAADGPAGLGLGLALSRSLARAMGGDVTHRPTPGGGATFVVRLPRV